MLQLALKICIMCNMLPFSCINQSLIFWAHRWNLLCKVLYESHSWRQSTRNSAIWVCECAFDSAFVLGSQQFEEVLFPSIPVRYFRCHIYGLKIVNPLYACKTKQHLPPIDDNSKIRMNHLLVMILPFPNFHLLVLVVKS